MTSPGAWRDAVDAFDEALTSQCAASGPRAGKTLSAATRESYAQHLGWLAAGVTVGPWSLGADELEGWLSRQRWSAQTRRKVLTSYRRFYEWGVSEGLCMWSPTAGLSTLPPKPRGAKRVTLPPAWEAPITRHCEAMRASGAAAGTVEQRLWRLRLLAEVASDPWSVTEQQLVELVARPGISAEYRRSIRNHLRTFYAWAVRAGYLEHSPADALPVVRVPRALPRPVDDDTFAAALARVDDRTRLAMLLAGYAGLRRFEIAKLRLDDVTTSHLVVRGKGGHTRLVPVHPHLGGELAAEAARRRDGRCGSGFPRAFTSPTGFLFPTDRAPDEPMTAAHLAKTVRAALGGGWTTHTLRHRFASAAYASTRDLRAVQELLGHTRPETTARYAAVPDRAMRDAVDAVSLPGPGGV